MEPLFVSAGTGREVTEQRRPAPALSQATASLKASLLGCAVCDRVAALGGQGPRRCCLWWCHAGGEGASGGRALRAAVVSFFSPFQLMTTWLWDSAAPFSWSSFPGRTFLDTLSEVWPGTSPVILNPSVGHWDCIATLSSNHREGGHSLRSLWPTWVTSSDPKPAQ